MLPTALTATSFGSGPQMQCLLVIVHAIFQVIIAIFVRTCCRKRRTLALELGCTLSDQGLLARSMSLSTNPSRLRAALQNAALVLKLALRDQGDLYCALRGSAPTGHAIEDAFADEPIQPDIDVDLIVFRAGNNRVVDAGTYIMFVRSIAESVRRYIESFAPASASITWASSEVTRSFKMITGQVEVEIFPKQGCGYPIFSGVECITCNNFGPDISGERDVITNVMKISHSPLNDLVQAPKHDPRNIAIIMIKYFIKLRKLWVKSYHLAALCNAKRYRSAQQHEFFHSVDATPFEPGRLIELPFQHFPGFDKSSALHWMSFLWCRVSLMRLSYRSLWLHPSPSHNKPAQVSSCDYIRKPKDKNDFFPTIEAAFQPFSDTVFRPLLERAWMHEMNDNDVKFYSRPADLDVMQRNPNVIGSNVLDACKL